MSPFPPLRLVTTGVYAAVAHPIYLGSILLTFGAAMATGSAAGMWIVTPALIAACVAFVHGYESQRTAALFGTAPRPFLRLPDATDETPDVSSRVSVYVLAILPWFLVYEAINLLETPAAAIGLATRWDRLIGVIGWTEILYFAVYPIVLAAPLVAKRRAQLRDLIVRTWIATAGAALIYLTLPATFEKKPIPASPFALMLEWERAFDAPNTHFPAFHVIWLILALEVYRPVLRWPLIIAVAASCVTTGMHAIVDVVAGIALGMLFVNWNSVWRLLVRGAEHLSGAWSEIRIGRLRLINHGIAAAVAAAAGIALIVTLAGPDHRGDTVAIAAIAIAGAAAWAQWMEGSAALLRPFGYYGGLLSGIAAIGVISAVNGSGWLLLAAYAVAAPLIQAIGRIRCLIQGCCHGRRCTGDGMRVTHASSRVVSKAGLSGVAIHPTQLYSIVMNVCIAAILIRLWMGAAPLTFIAGAYLMLAGFCRFIEERHRGEPQTTTLGGLRIYQWMSIASVIAGAILLAIPSAAAPAPQMPDGSTLAAALIAGAAVYFLYGADFPDSPRRFARLT